MFAAGTSQPKPRHRDSTVICGVAVVGIGLGVWEITQGLVQIALLYFAASAATVGAIRFRARASRNL